MSAVLSVLPPSMRMYSSAKRQASDVRPLMLAPGSRSTSVTVAQWTITPTRYLSLEDKWRR